MGENCANCLNMKSMEDKIKAIWHEIDDSKAQRKELSDRVGILEGNEKETRETIKWIKDSIDEIKNSVGEIAAALKEMQLKGSKTMDGLINEGLKYIVVSVIMFAIARATV